MMVNHRVIHSFGALKYALAMMGACERVAATGNVAGKTMTIEVDDERLGTKATYVAVKQWPSAV